MCFLEWLQYSYHIPLYPQDIFWAYFHFLTLTEIWFSSEDTISFAALLNGAYFFSQHPTFHRLEGGVAILWGSYCLALLTLSHIGPCYLLNFWLLFLSTGDLNNWILVVFYHKPCCHRPASLQCPHGQSTHCPAIVSLTSDSLLPSVTHPNSYTLEITLIINRNVS